MKRSWILVGIVAVSAGWTSSLDAQIIDSRGRASFGAPKAWASLFAGWASHRMLCNSASETCWDFGSALQWRGTVEMPVGNGVTLGVAGTRSRMPLLHHDNLAGGSGRDADADVSQILGQLRIGGGSGIHQVIDVTAGASLYSNFRATDGTQLRPVGSVTNWSFALAIGFALPLSPRAQVVLLQEYGIVIGKRVSGQSSNTAQHNTLRIGGRFGLGG